MVVVVAVAFTGTRLSEGRSRVELTCELLWRAGVVAEPAGEACEIRGKRNIWD